MISALGRAILLVGIVALTGAVGCSDDDDGAPSADDLAGRTFVSTAVEGWTLVDGTAVKISFVDEVVVADAGCNSMFGELQISDGRLDVGTLGTTMMACEDDLQNQDVWLAGFLEEGPEVALADGVLTLTSGSSKVTLSEEA